MYISIMNPSSAKSETWFTVKTAFIMFWSHKLLCLSCIQFDFGNYAILFSYGRIWLLLFFDC